MAKKPLSVSSGVRRGPKPSRSAGRSTLVLKTAKPPGKSPVSVMDESSLDPVSKKGVHFPVVGIGASAGGFEAVTSLLKHLPTDTGMAFVVVLHLDPMHKSRLTELLARATGMPVREIKDNMPVEPNQVYTLPPNMGVILAGNKLKLVRRPESQHPHLPVDLFFSSLAEEQGSRAIGVVLSGTGSDGTLGLIAIKAESGITIAEAESSAKFFGMPRSAIDAGCVDAVLTPEQLANELVRIARHPFVRPLSPEAKLPTMDFPESADVLAKIFYLLKQTFSVDFTMYKDATLRRRIRRRMVLQRIERVEDYVAMLRSHPEEMEALFQDLLITVTGFFRDRRVYAILKQKVVPRLVKSKGGGQGELRVWVPGCATGEEVYSLAICFMEEISRSRRQLKLQIFGTDLSDVTIAKARAGVYPSRIARDVSRERLRRFFTRLEGGDYQISRVIREMCTFARQNICEDPPFSRLDLISCRNLLIYLGPELQNKCAHVFQYALNPGGYLVLGTAETVGAAAELFTFVDKKNKIYCRKIDAPPPDLELGSRGIPRDQPQLSRVATHSRRVIEPLLHLQKQVDRILLHRYTPVGVVVDLHLHVHEFRGSTGPYLEHAPGTANLNLLQMVCPSLLVDLRTAIHKALKQFAPARKESVLRNKSGSRPVSIQVVPFKVAPSSDVWLLILFEELKRSAQSDQERSDSPQGRSLTRDTGRRDPEIVRLRAELDATKESLQAIIEEQEATNEELKSTNEEIESSNEELQSTNEEMETAKEELQSTNEELTTLNEELSNRNMEMAQINNDLTNLLSSINIPIIMVDNALAVRRATPMAERLFNLIPTDIGRRLSDLKANLNVENLDQMIREVIETLNNRETRVQDNQGHWYSLRIRPYRTRENKIDGAVITLVDIDEQQRRIARLESLSEYNDAVMDTSRELLLVLDAALRVRTASRGFCGTFQLDSKKIENMPLGELSDRAWDIPELRRALLDEVLPQDKRLENFRVDREFPGLGRCAWMLNARRLGSPDEPLILLALQKIPDLPSSGSSAATAK
jgi:two-component system, chemotaxis family, CheB/CheR fusion protein